MKKGQKKPAPRPEFTSLSQLTIDGFETPFSQKLDATNRWVLLANLIPWDEICNIYLKHVGVKTTGRPPISPRIVIGSLIIKHLCNLDDREVVAQITENMYMQYFLGYSSFTTQAPFDPSLFVEFRTRMGMDQINAINDKIHSMHQSIENKKVIATGNKNGNNTDINNQVVDNKEDIESINIEITHKGKAILDATACPQNIAYPTDIDVLNSARVKSEEIIDILYEASLHTKKPRTYREIARKLYLKIAQNKNKSKKLIRKAIRKQLGFLNRNIKSIHKLLETSEKAGILAIPLKRKEYKYLLVIQTAYQQQKQMYDNNVHQVDDRIVSIHQPHVRPIVRGKSTAKVEFGSKIHVTLIDGYAFIDELSWDAFNEGSHLQDYIENYKHRFGYYPEEILADKIYCTRANRQLLKEQNIKLIGKPLGRPSAVKKNYVRPGERNPIEGKFGQAKTAYGLDNIKARLKETSENWIACIFLVLNLVKLAGQVLLYPIVLKIKMTFSAQIQRIQPENFIVLRAA